MVNLLIVSHSARLAEGVKEFTDQVAAGQIKIAAVGGAADGSLGTDVDRIVKELKEVSSPEGVLILVDLKGAVIAVETALDMVDEMKVKISDAPLVEGAYMAAIEASVGATLDETASAALQARDLTKVHRS